MLSQAHPALSVHLCKDYETLQQQWMSLFATQRPIFWTERTPQIWQFVYFESSHCQKWHGVNYKGLVDAITSSLYLWYVYKDSYETLQQQLRPLIIAQQHPTSHAKSVPKIWHFVRNLRVLLNRHDRL